MRGSSDATFARLEHRERGRPRVERREPPLAVERDREPAQRRPQAQDGGVEARPAHGARADEVVVALVDPGAAANVGRGEQVEQRLRVVRAPRRRRPRCGARLLRDVVARALVGEQPRRDRADHLVAVEGAQEPGVGHLADRGAGQLPALADLRQRLEHLRADDRDHPLLALRDHDLPRLHPLLAQRHAVEMDVEPALGGHLGEGGGEARGAAVLQRLDEPALGQLDRDLDQLLARERVADLDRRPLVGVVLAELLAREHARAADSVTAGRRAVEDDEVADPGGLRRGEPLRRQQPDAHRIDQAVVRVGLVEDGLAAHGRDPCGVAVGADSGDGSVEVVVGRAEAQPVEQRDRPRAHRDDVAEDPADPRRRPLERLHRRGVVVALDLERDRLTVAQVDHPGVLARPLQDSFSRGRKPLQQARRVLVAAVLRPEEREDGELEVVRLPGEQLTDTVVLAVGKAESTMKRLFRDPRQMKQHTREGGRVTPSLNPP